MIKTLLGIRFRAFLTVLGGRNRKGETKPISKGKLALMAVLYLYLAVCFAGISAVNAVAIGRAVIGTEIEWIFFALFLALPFAVVLLFSIFEMKSEIFESRDNQILIPLPIPARAIVFSRVLTVLIFNYIESAIMVLPAFVAYLTLGGNVSYFFGGLFMSFFVPLCATALSSAIGYAVAAIASRMKRKNIATLLISLFFLFLYWFFYGKLMGSSTGFSEALVSALPILEQYSVLRFIGESAMWNPLSLGAVIFLSVGSFAIAYFFISRNFMRLVTREKSVHYTYKEKKESAKSPFLSLCGKEIRRFTSSASYMLNASSGVIMCVVFAVILYTKRADYAGLSDMLGIQTGLFPILLTALVTVSAMSSVSASSVSLEGKNLWLLQSLPIPPKTILLAKAVPHFLLSAPITAACCLFVSFLLPATVFERIFAFILPIAVSLAMALLGVVINVYFPKFDWVNETAVVKQSLPVFIFTFAPILLGILLVGVTFFFTTIGIGILGLVLSFALFSIVAVISYFWLIGPCAVRFEQLS